MAKNNIQKPAAGANTASVPAAPSAPSAPAAGKDDGGDLDPGDSGPRVTKLQEELAERGFYKGKFDGDFGPKTTAAVIAYKESKGYGPGGKAGKRVLDDLGIGL
jgi:peptidoglycan hydrolase-like protein with peptidoglycan-binding domain